MLTSVSNIFWGGVLFWEVGCWVLAGVDCHALVARSFGMFSKAWPCKGDVFTSSRTHYCSTRSGMGV